jgi:hypothetical protein
MSDLEERVAAAIVATARRALSLAIARRYAQAALAVVNAPTAAETAVPCDLAGLTINEAAALIPEGWQFLLVRSGAGWAAELLRRDVGVIANEADTAAEALSLVLQEVRRP